jgi:hypothetical protein
MKKYAGIEKLKVIENKKGKTFSGIIPKYLLVGKSIDWSCPVKSYKKSVVDFGNNQNAWNDDIEEVKERKHIYIVTNVDAGLPGILESNKYFESAYIKEAAIYFDCDKDAVKEYDEGDWTGTFLMSLFNLMIHQKAPNCVAYNNVMSGSNDVSYITISGNKKEFREFVKTVFGNK